MGTKGHEPMTNPSANPKPTILRLLLALCSVALLAASCAGTETPAVEAAETGQEPSPSVVGTVPTTAPVELETAGNDPTNDADDSAEVAAAPSDEDAAEILGDEDPWEVTVLTVKDDTVIVPTFDGPNGNNVKIYDVNQIDGVELEYPLYAETAFGNRLALVVEQFDDTGAWAEVGVPVRPNGTTTWVQTAFFTESTHNYHITVDISENTVNVYKGDELLIEQIAASGRESRPTPVVRAYIDEMIPGAQVSPAYGAWILSISAFSESLGTFGGGMPKLALHGTNQPELMGQYISSGCVRVPDEVINFIAETVPVGTIIDIVA